MFRRTLQDGQRKVYYHDVISVDYRGVKVTINENGTVTFRKDVNDKEYDEITVPANAIFRTANLLNNTRKVRFEDKDGRDTTKAKREDT